jgi:hypothetical protein
MYTQSIGSNTFFTTNTVCFIVVTVMWDSPGSKLILMFTMRGNGNHGHEREQYGTELDDNNKLSLIEYLQTL